MLIASANIPATAILSTDKILKSKRILHIRKSNLLLSSIKNILRVIRNFIYKVIKFIFYCFVVFSCVFTVLIAAFGYFRRKNSSEIITKIVLNNLKNKVVINNVLKSKIFINEIFKNKVFLIGKLRKVADLLQQAHERETGNHPNASNIDNASQSTNATNESFLSNN